MKSLTRYSKFGLCAVAALGLAGACFAQFLDRNFQRFDHIDVHPIRGAANAMPEPIITMAGAFGLTFPESMRSYSGSFIYSRAPMGNADGFGTFSSTTTYQRFNPSGGTSADGLSETLQYQLNHDKEGALTLGFIGSAANSGGPTTYTPSVSLTPWSDQQSGLSFTPTLSWSRVNAGGAHTDGFIPDLELLYQAPKTYAFSADYVFPTRVGGAAAIQFAGKVDLTTSKDPFNSRGGIALKGAVTVSQLFQPGYALQLVYKF